MQHNYWRKDRGVFMNKKLIVIGAGVAGLAAGIYARLNDFDSVIYESHDIAGGVCTSWKRKDFIIDGCLHWLMIDTPGTPTYDTWRELGILEECRFLPIDVFLVIHGQQGESLIVYSDVDKFESEMLRVAPEDQELIKQFGDTIRLYQIMQESKDEKENRRTFFRIVRRLSNAQGGLMKVREYAHRFRNPFLRKAFPLILGRDTTVGILAMTLAQFANKIVAVPEGGSLAFSNKLLEKYKNLGGEIVYKKTAERILKRDGKSYGVVFEDGTQSEADYIIWAGDGHSLLYDLLADEEKDASTQKHYQSGTLFAPLVQLSLCLDGEIANMPNRQIIITQEPVFKDGYGEDYILLNNYQYDKTLMPEGKSIINVLLNTSYAYWNSLGYHTKEYKEAKNQVKDHIVKVLSKHYPDLTEKISYLEVATPLTWERYTKNWRGSYEGFLSSPENLNYKPKSTLKGLENIYMCGQWVQIGGGVSTCVLSGKNTILEICQREEQNSIK